MNKKYLVVLFIVGILSVACSKEESEVKLIEEEQKLDEWVSANDINAKKISGGVYISVAETSSPKPEAGQYILFNYRQRFLADFTLELSSSASDDALYLQKYVYGGPELLQLTAPLVGIYAAIAKMGEGQSANIYFSSRNNAFSDNRDFKSRKMELELVKIIPGLSLYQDSLSYHHIADGVECVKIDTIATQSISDQKKHNILYSVINEGNGARMKGKTVVNTNITAYYALQKSQKIFWENEEKVNIINDNRFHGFTNNNYIDKIVRDMQIGGNLRIAMPSDLCMQYSGQDSQYVVPMGSVVIFDIKIVE
ncbi:hypothetical protein FACS189464_3370 [Bacteroidia bacterium]|nr:hypothetical protein FACS189464_3370 [Bacteroidia bacterium]